MKNNSGSQRHLLVTSEGTKKNVLLLWLSMNEKLVIKNFPFFKVLRDFFRYVISHAYAENLKSGFDYSTKYTTKKFIDECRFEIQFLKKLIIGSKTKYIEIVGFLRHFFSFATEIVGRSSPFEVFILFKPSSIRLIGNVLRFPYTTKPSLLLKRPFLLFTNIF